MSKSETGFIGSASRTAGQPSPDGGGGDNIVDLVRQLAGQGSHLAEQQLSLVKAEIRQATSEVTTAVGSMVGAAVVGIAGLGVLLMAFAYLLGDAIDNLGLATLIVGVATLALAYFLYQTGVKKISHAHLVPQRSQRTLERTPEIARGDLHTEHTR
ncbi:MAG: phage holin family protein [Sphingomicrobium sp.]